MANHGAKKRLEENTRRMRVLRIAFLVGLAVQCLARAFSCLRGQHVSGWLWFGTVASMAASWFTYSSIAAMAAPTWADGELVDGGADLNRGGFCGYYHDILYISVFVQVASVLSSWFWMTYAAIPAYALYKAFTMVIIPYFMQSSKSDDGQMSDAMRKRLEKTEKRAERRRQKRF